LTDKSLLEGVIVNGKGAMAGNPNIQGEDLDQLVEFVQSLKK
jgi:hypothetical protein